MRTKKLKGILIATTIITVAGYSVYANQEKESLSEIMLANIEALAVDEIDPNKAYGYELQNCYDDEERITGAHCVQVEDKTASCRYSSAWGKCN